MCGRYTLKTSPVELQSELGIVIDAATQESMRPRYNVSPTQRVAVVRNDGRNQVELFRWGLIPSWAKAASIGSKMINARAETLAEKPSFRVPLRKRRCIVLADGFFEWRVDGKRKQPMYIRLGSKKAFAIAGLWESWRDPSAPESDVIHTCTLITTTPNEFMSTLHDRMPVILPKERIAEWLAQDAKEPAELLPLLKSWEGEPLEAHPVSSLVNSPKSDRPECIEPDEAPELFTA